jgi:glutamate-ammonia-ligase adenylyltransferase
VKDTIPTLLLPILEHHQILAQQLENLACSSLMTAQWTKVLVGSDYVSDSLLGRPKLLKSLIDSQLCEQDYKKGEMHQQLAERLIGVDDEEALSKTLRQFRQYQMVRIIYRDMNRLAQMSQITFELSELAAACIELSTIWLHESCVQKWGQPIGKVSGEAQALVVLGMGKLGAHELNLSSDIDLIFTFPESGETQGSTNENDKRVSISNQEFFTRLGQRLIQALDVTTADGFVFRVDMRLRPYGQSGSLALSFAAIEEYYQDQGRDWERFAMIKARAVAGPAVFAERLLTILRSFTYRAYVDFSAFESLRDMKRMITNEVRRRGLSNNIKLGRGGIREIEFIAQAFQLIRGGQDKGLQERRLMKLLGILSAEGFLPPKVIEDLSHAYVFLRNSEHIIQGIGDKQTQALPDNEKDQTRLYWLMGFASWDAYLTALNEIRDNVSYHFDQLVAEDEDEDAEDKRVALGWSELWLGQRQELSELSEEARNPHSDLGQCTHSEAVQTQISTLRNDRRTQNMQAIGRQRLDKFMPRLLAELWSNENPVTTLERIVPLIEAILRRTSYLVLLIENPQALAQLVRLCGSSPWIATSLAESPILLDELLDPANLNSPPNKSDMAAALQQKLLRIDADDLEEQMDALRHFTKTQMLQVAASEVTGALSLMKTSDYLTHLAEVVLSQVLGLAWQQMTEKYGFPLDQNNQPEIQENFVIIGYGKMGGIELSYGSDLDLVFMHNTASNKMTNGSRSIDNLTFYSRLGQRIIHILDTRTRAGQLYETDMRLRPSGASGMIVCSLMSFEKYQKEQAWAWEHQALTRARVVAGNPEVACLFSQIRDEILAQKRDLHQLRKEVRDMRQKMRDNLGSKAPADRQTEMFHLKQDAGGIVDIEFMVQYCVLAWSHKQPDLLTYTDNIRVLDGIANAALMTSNDASVLQKAYLAYRVLAHRRGLQQQTMLLTDTALTGEIAEYRQQVCDIWSKLLNAT